MKKKHKNPHTVTQVSRVGMLELEEAAPSVGQVGKPPAYKMRTALSLSLCARVLDDPSVKTGSKRHEECTAGNSISTNHACVAELLYLQR